MADGTTNPATGEPYKFSDVVSDYTNQFKIMGDGVAPPPKDVNALMERNHRNLMNTAIPDETAKNFARFVFSDKRLLPQIENSEKLNFMKMYANPSVGERIYSFNDPKLIQDYKQFIVDGTVSVSTNITGNINDIKSFQDFATSARGLMDLRYNPETNRIEGGVPTGQALRSMARNPTVGVILEAQALKAQDTVNKLNETLGILEPVFKRDGAASVPPALISFLMRMGIQVKIPEAAIKDMQQGGGAKKVDDKAVQTLMQPEAVLSGGLPVAPTAGTTNLTGDAAVTKPDLVAPQPTLGVPRDEATTPTGQLEQGNIDLSTRPAIDHYRKTGEHLGKFDTPANADAFGKALSKQAISQATVNPLTRIIRRAEGVKDTEGYNRSYGGRQFPLTDMTVSEVQQLQKALPANQRAVGINQLIPKTLSSLVREMGLKGDEQFTPELQDKMMDTLLERRGLSAWKAGKLTDEQFMDRLSQEWAGLPMSTGISYHHGTGTNKATVSLAALKKALEEYKKNN